MGCKLMGNLVEDGGDGGSVCARGGEGVAVLVDELHEQQVCLRVPSCRRRHAITGGASRSMINVCMPRSDPDRRRLVA